jgi:two-component system, OmpR family, response regulator
MNTLPATLALIDDDREYSEFLAQHLRALGVKVQVFLDSNDLLADAQAYGYDFYVVDLMLPGVDGVELIKVLRRRTQGGIVVVSGKLAPNLFRDVVAAGADMYLTKPVQFEQVAVAISAVQRRAGGPGALAQAPWQLNVRARELVAPDGARVALSEADLTVMQCLAEAAGKPVTRGALRERLGQKHVETEDAAGQEDSGAVDGSEGKPGAEAGDGLNAVIYRLRRRIERCTPLLVPLQSRSRVGYLFRAPLEVL